MKSLINQQHYAGLIKALLWRGSWLFFACLSSNVHLAAQGLLISSGTYVRSGNNLLITYGNLSNNGLFNAGTGTVLFAGNSQAINGSNAIQFNNITLSSSSTTFINTTGQTLSGVLLCNGILNVNGNLTLLASVSNSALIDGSGSGVVAGNLKMQGYINSGYGYRYLSSPFAAVTVSQFSGQVNLTASFPAFYQYIESQATSGWQAYTTAANILNPGQGYALNFGSNTAPLTLTLNGTATNGNLSLNLFNHNNAYTLGFNLVGNPYPSPIDWDAGSGWTRSNIDNAVYFFNAGTSDPYSGTYSSYINGVSSNGIANNLIPAMQGFFVHVSNGTFPVSAVLGMSNQIRTRSGSSKAIAIGKPQGKSIRLSALSAGSLSESGGKAYLRIQASLAGAFVSDPAVIYLDSKPLSLFDKNLDALKLMNTDATVPSLYFLSQDTSRLSILAIDSDLPDQKSIQIGVQTQKDGVLRFEMPDFSGIPYSHVYIKDAQKKTQIDLRSGTAYTLSLSAGVYENRFSILLTNSDPLQNQGLSEPIFYCNAEKIYAGLNSLTGNSGKLILYSMNGQLVWTHDIEGLGNHVLYTGVSRGIYILSFASQAGTYTKKVIIGNAN